MKLRSFKDLALIRTIYWKLRKNVVAGPGRLLIYSHVCLDAVSYTHLQVLCQEIGYDWVVSVSYPFANHLAAARWTPSNTKLAFYNLDPYWNNGTYMPQLAEARAAEEVKAYCRADCVFCTPEQLQDYQGEVFCDVRKKIHPLPYPKLVRPVLRDK